MHKTQTFIQRDISGETMLIPIGETARNFNGMITLQGIGGFIWEHIEEAESLEHLIDMVTAEYDVDRKTAGGDALFFIMQLLRAGMIRPTGKDW
ncbi:MAG: PqqD family protein [Prevotella sp.]|nr:PqqD family protein [Prevotella sp.]